MAVPEQRVLSWLTARLEGWYSASLEDLSVDFFDQEDDMVGGHYLLPQTYAPILEELANGIEDTVRLGHEVEENHQSRLA